MADDIRLQILVCDRDEVTNASLISILRSKSAVDEVKSVRSLQEAERAIEVGGINTIFIDPMTLGLDEAGKFILGIRARLPYIVFVLYMDVAQAEANSAEFYQGSRSRLSHYYRLDKQTPISAFSAEVDAVLKSCELWVQWELPKRDVRNLKQETQRLAESTQDTTLQELTRRLDELLARLPENDPRYSSLASGRMRKNSVFLSYRFADSDYVNGLKEFLDDKGFEVVTGEAAAGYISKAIIQRILECEYFLCLMTRDTEKTDGTYTTSPWLLEEKGVALAYNKYIVLLIEEGVTDYGGLQGDWQRHHFAPKGFLAAALKAVQQLQSASGRPEEIDR